MTTADTQQILNAVWDVRYNRPGDSHNRNLDTVLNYLDNLGSAVKRLCIAFAIPIHDLNLDLPGGPSTPDDFDVDSGP